MKDVVLGRKSARSSGPHPVDVHVGARIKLKRVFCHMSQEELARAIGVTFQQVQKYESGFNRVSASRLFGISGVLNTPIEFFFQEMGDDAGAQASVDEGTSEQNAAHWSETAVLVRAFAQIKDPAIRKAVASMVKVVSKPAED